MMVAGEGLIDKNSILLLSFLDPMSFGHSECNMVYRELDYLRMN